MKRAADSLLHHPGRIYDLQSAQRVKFCGPNIAKV
jgi:hypothetical protein